MSRTTVELPDSQLEALQAIARRRGLRGFSTIVEEALAVYFADLNTDEIDLLLSLEGSVSDDEADEIERRIEAARATWRAL